MNKNLTRREFAKLTGVAAVTAAVASAVNIPAAQASEKAVVMADVTKHGQAKQLQYVVKAKDASKKCANCSFYQDKLAKDAKVAAPCQIMIEKGQKLSVLAEAGCVSFSPKA